MLPVLRIRDVNPRSEFFTTPYHGSGVKKIPNPPNPDPHQRILIF